MKKKILGLVVATLTGILMLSSPVSAAVVRTDTGYVDNSCAQEFLGMRPWYYGLTVRESDGSCEIGMPDTGCKAGQENCDITKASDGTAKFIWAIILNILVDLFTISGLIAIGFMIYGGYFYLRSGGDPNFATKGRKALTAAVVGFLIVTLANIISRLIVEILTAAS